MQRALPEYVEGLPNISGSEDQITEAMRERPQGVRGAQAIDFAHAKSTFAMALHMHQPLIPAGGGDLRTAKVISNLQHMFENQGVGDNHNAGVFYDCYKRLGRFVPELVHRGKKPRIMLEYSGCLLHGLREMGSEDLFEDLRRITCNPEYSQCVEWLGAPWGHPVAPSTPSQDYRLHVRAFQHHFAALFGLDAVKRVRGFSPSEMALPNHPDVAYEFVRTLKECGFEWVLVQEHTVEELNGRGITEPHLPHRLMAQSSRGEVASIIAIIKTQGSDTKLVAQGQPYYEARGLGRIEFKGRPVPPLVTQIADGENGGVMMNEFPPKFFEVMDQASHSDTPAVNVSEYLDYLSDQGLGEESFPKIQPLFQHKIWERMTPGSGPEALSSAISDLKREDHRFHMEGGSWTSDRSWVQGYDHVLGPMEEASALFAEKVLSSGVQTSEHRYRNALFHLLTSQTSCYRYWGEGVWTEYGKELCRRLTEIIRHDF